MGIFKGSNVLPSLFTFLTSTTHNDTNTSSKITIIINKESLKSTSEATRPRHAAAAEFAEIKTSHEKRAKFKRQVNDQPCVVTTRDTLLLGIPSKVDPK